MASEAISPKVLQDHSSPFPDAIPLLSFVKIRPVFEEITEDVLQTQYNIGVTCSKFQPKIITESSLNSLYGKFTATVTDADSAETPDYAHRHKISSRIEHQQSTRQLIFVCNQRLNLLCQLKRQGLPWNCLDLVFDSLIMSKLLDASPSCMAILKC